MALGVGGGLYLRMTWGGGGSLHWNVCVYMACAFDVMNLCYRLIASCALYRYFTLALAKDGSMDCIHYIGLTRNSKLLDPQNAK